MFVKSTQITWLHKERLKLNDKACIDIFVSFLGFCSVLFFNVYLTQCNDFFEKQLLLHINVKRPNISKLSEVHQSIIHKWKSFKAVAILPRSGWPSKFTPNWFPRGTTQTPQASVIMLKFMTVHFEKTEKYGLFGRVAKPHLSKREYGSTIKICKVAWTNHRTKTQRRGCLAVMHSTMLKPNTPHTNSQSQWWRRDDLD